MIAQQYFYTFRMDLELRQKGVLNPKPATAKIKQKDLAVGKFFLIYNLQIQNLETI